MALKLPLFFLLCFFSAPLFAAEAKITGQSKATVGVMFVLDGKESKGDNFQWIASPKLLSLPESKRPTPMICGTQFGLSIVVPGSYYFHYVASDESGISVATHLVEVESGDDNQSPPSPEPPSPGDPPAPSFSGVKKASDEQVAALADPITAKRLASALSSISPHPTLKETATSVQQAVEQVLLTRDDEQRDVPWLNWRTAVNKEIDKLSLSSPETYMQVLQVLITSLQETPAQALSSVKPSLRVYTRANCQPCNIWKQLEYPKLTGWNVIFTVDATRPTPSFEVNGKTFVGYTSAETLKNAYGTQ